MQWAHQRACPFETPALRACWERSAILIKDLQDEFDQAGITERVRTVYVAGSLGRMEAVPESDCDLVVVLNEQDRSADVGREIVEAVFDCVSRTGFQRPKLGGIFGSPTSFEQLLDPTTSGKVDEDLAVFGKRIQALLDSQPLVHFGEFTSLQSAILRRYAGAPQADPTSSELAWLLDDLIRYWRSLCARTRWLDHNNTNQWRALNVKVRHSRMLLCAGLFRLLCHLAAASSDGSAGSDNSGGTTTQLTNLLPLVPLERVSVPGDKLIECLAGSNRNGELQLNGDSQSLTSAAQSIAHQYEIFLAAMSLGLVNQVANPDTFASLINNGSTMSTAVGQLFEQEFGDRVSSTLFGELK